MAHLHDNVHLRVKMSCVIAGGSVSQGPSEHHEKHDLAVTQGGERAVLPAAPPVVQLGKLSGLHWPVSWLLRVLGGLSAIILLVAGIGYFRLSQGPISLQFLVSPIEQSLNRELIDVSVKVQDAVLRRSRRGGVEFRLTNVVLSDASGVPIALAPLAGVEISGLALMGGQLAASRIDLIGARMLLLQGNDGSLSVQFSKPETIPATGSGTADAARAARAVVAAGQGAQIATSANGAEIIVPPAMLISQLDLAKSIAQATAKARRRTDASSYLRAVGLRQTTVIFDKHGRRSVWHVPDFDIAFKHTKIDSVIKSKAVIDTPRGPWSMKFDVQDSERTKTLTVTSAISNLVPRTLAQTLPQFAMFDIFDLPVSGRSKVQLNTNGQVLRGDVALDLAPGNLRLPWFGGTTLQIDGGQLNFSYNNAADTIDIAPSRVKWGRSFLTIAGKISPGPKQGGHNVWKFDIRTIDGALAPEDQAKPVIPVQNMTMTGWITPAIGRVQLGQFYINVGGAEIAVAADVVDVGGKARARLEGRIGSMSLHVLKAIWPQALSPDARGYIEEHLRRAQITGGVFKFSTIDGSNARQANNGASGSQPNGAMSLTLKLSKLALSVYDRGPVLHARRALLRLDGNKLEVSVPKARIRGRNGKNIVLSAGRFVIGDLSAPLPLGEIEFRTRGRVADAAALAQTRPINLLDAKLVSPKGLGGNFDGKLKIRLPLRDDLDIEEMKIEGAINISDGSVKLPGSPVKISSVAMKIAVSSRAVNVRGKLLLNGIIAKLNWQRIFGLPPDKQPALRLTTSLDDADRVQLGVDVNHLVTGIVPVDVSVAKVGLADQAIHVRINLGKAELRLKSMAWTKPKGARAVLQFDVVKGSGYPYELQSFKLVGDNVAIDGWLALDKDFNAREFYFPEFSVNVVTRLEVQGLLSKDNVWNIKAKGATFDGRDFFSSLFDLDRINAPKRRSRKNQPGINLVVTIDNVIGYGDISLRDFKVSLRERENKLRFIEARGLLDGMPLTVKLDPKKKQKRIVFAQTARAGKAFRMIGFYPNLRRGRATLKVNLDGRGVAETTGQLEVRKFSILGDQIVSEVLQSIDEGRPAIASRRPRRVVRQRFDFDRLSVPFSVGQGQFVISDSSIKGPVIGASIRGKVDFKARRLNLGGTYVPLSGLNSAFCQIPLLGQILTGPRCEGVFGITFAVKGNLGNPEVIVNPLSMLTPGFLRELMALTPLNPTIKKRGGKSKRARRAATRSSSSPAATRRRKSKSRAGGKRGKSSGPAVLNGWSAEAKPN